MDTRNQSTGRFCNWQFAIVLFAPFCSPVLAAPSRLPAPLLPKVPTWHPPQVSDVKAQVNAWLWQNTADAAQREKALAVVKGISDRATGAELLDFWPGLFPWLIPGSRSFEYLFASPHPPGPARLRLPGRCQDSPARGRQHAALLRPLARAGAVVRKRPWSSSAV